MAMNFKLFFYKYELGITFKKDTSTKEVFNICFNDAIINSDKVFIKQIRKVLSNSKTPKLLRTHILKGINLLPAGSEIPLEKLDNCFEYEGRELTYLKDGIEDESYYYFY